MFDPISFFHLADALNQSASDESELRTSISRAYYSAFLIAKDKTQIKIKGAKAHAAVVSELKSKFQEHLLSNQLESLRIRRNEADYDADLTISKSHSNEALRLAGQIIHGLGAK